MSTLTDQDMRPFWSQVTESPESGCWVWAGVVSNQYGYWTPPTQTGLGRGPAHRFAYMHMVCEIPAGLELDHLCRHKLCVNPEHLDPVTHAENRRRARGPNRPRRGSIESPLKMARIEAGLTLADLSEVVGISGGTLSAYENGKARIRPVVRARILRAIADALLEERAA